MHCIPPRPAGAIEERNRQTQGKRKLSAWEAKDLREEVFIPAGHATPHGDAFLVLDLLQESDGEAFQPGNIVAGFESGIA